MNQSGLFTSPPSISMATASAQSHTPAPQLPNPTASLPHLHRSPAPLRPGIISHRPADDHRSAQLQPLYSPPPISPRTGYTGDQERIGDRNSASSLGHWGAHKRGSGALSSSSSSHTGPTLIQPPPPSTSTSSSSGPTHPHHPPAPQEPKFNSNTSYESSSSPRFGPHSLPPASQFPHPSTPGLSHSHHQRHQPPPPSQPEWVHSRSMAPGSVMQYQHYPQHPHEHSEYSISSNASSRQSSGYPAPLSSGPPSTPHFPNPGTRSYSESHIHTQSQGHYRAEPFSPPVLPPAHGPNLQYESSNYDRRPSISNSHHSSYEARSQGSFSIPNGHHPRDLPPTPKGAGPISPSVPMLSNGIGSMRQNGINALDALATATLGEGRNHGQQGGHRQSIAVPPPFRQEHGNYGAPGSLQRHTSMESLGSLHDRDDRVLKRQRTDENVNGQISPFMSNTRASLPEPEIDSNGNKGLPKKRKMTIDTSELGSSSKSPTSGLHASPPGSVNGSINGIPFNSEWGWTKGGKPRQRLPLACLSCRHKKIRCRPSDIKGEKCAHCSKMNLECQYGKKETKAKSNKDKASQSAANSTSKFEESNAVSPKTEGRDESSVRIEKSVKQETAASPSTVQGSPPEAKLQEDTMEGVIKEEIHQSPALDSMEVDIIPVTTSPATVVSTTPIFVAKSPGLQPKAEVTSTVSPKDMTSSSFDTRVNSVVHQGSYVRTGSHASPRTQYSSPNTSSSHASTLKEVLPSAKAKRKPGRSPRIEVMIPPLINLDPRHQALPDAQTLEHLVGLYFSHVYSQTYAFLHRISFMEELQKDTPYRPTLLLALCAVSARFSESQRSYEEFYAQHARQSILEHFDQNNLEIVQSMILMGLHDFGSLNGDKAWMFCGMAVRMGAALNLNLPSNTRKSFILAETERRTYWSYYLMDHFNGYGVARPFLTQDEDCQIQLPCDQPSFDKGIPRVTEFLKGTNPSHPGCGNTYMGAMAFLVRITSIWGKILKAIHFHRQIEKTDPNYEEIKRKTFYELHAECLDWDRQLPKGLRYSSANITPQVNYGTVGNFVMMHVMFHAAMIYLYRYLYTVSKPVEELVMGIRKAFIHGDAVLQIMEHVHQKREEAEKNNEMKVVVIAPFLGHIIRESCEIALKRLPRMPPGETLDNQLRRVIRGVEWVKELKAYWKPLEKMYDQLERIVRPVLRQRKAMATSPAISNNSLENCLSNTPPDMMIGGQSGVMVPSAESASTSTSFIDPLFNNFNFLYDSNINGGFDVPSEIWMYAFDGGEAQFLEGLANQETGVFPDLYYELPTSTYDPPMEMPLDIPQIDLDAAATAAVQEGEGEEENTDDDNSVKDEPPDSSTTYFSLKKATINEAEAVADGSSVVGEDVPKEDVQEEVGVTAVVEKTKKDAEGDLLKMLDAQEGEEVAKKVEDVEKTAVEKTVVEGEMISEDGVN